MTLFTHWILVLKSSQAIVYTEWKILRNKQKVKKRTWRERFLQALAWGRPATQQPPQTAAPIPLLPAQQIVATPAHHQLVHSPSIHNLPPPSAPNSGFPALPAPAPSLPALPAPAANTNYPTVLYSANSFLKVQGGKDKADHHNFHWKTLTGHQAKFRNFQSNPGHTAWRQST